MSDTLLMARRALLGHIAALIGAAALPADALAASPGSKTRGFLSAARLSLLAAVADTLLPATDTPGALAADVPARLDALLANWASAGTRKQVIEALDRIEATARTQRGAGFPALSESDREAVLRPHDAAALKPVAPPPGAPKATSFAPAAYFADQGYYRIKELVIDLYYYSKPGARTELVYEHVPGAWQASTRLTADSRPYLGVGFF